MNKPKKTRMPVQGKGITKKISMGNYQYSAENTSQNSVEYCQQFFHPMQQAQCMTSQAMW